MRDINLLPPKQRQKRLALSLVTYITFGFFILVVTIVGFAVTLTTIQVTVSDKISNYSTQRENVEKRIASFKTLEDDVITTNKALQAAGTALDQQLHPNNVLKAITDHMGPHLIFTSLTYGHSTTAASITPAAAADTLQLTIAGTAQSRADVVEFKRALDQDPQFQNISYTVASSSGSADTATPGAPSGLTFTVNLTVNQTVNKADKKP